MKNNRPSKLLVAIILCGVAFTAFPQKAHAFLGFPSCPFKKNAALCAALPVIGQQTGRKIIVVNADEVIVGCSLGGDASQKCSAKNAKANGSQKCCASMPKCGQKLPCPVTKQTLADGQTRTITKKCGTKTMSAKVFALRNAQGKIIGAVLISQPNS